MTTTTKRKAKAPKRMDSYFSVFNSHINNASARADAEFIAQFGQEKFDEVIAPLHAAGIMSVFHDAPTSFTMAWVSLCTYMVNTRLLLRDDTKKRPPRAEGATHSRPYRWRPVPRNAGVAGRKE